MSRWRVLPLVVAMVLAPAVVMAQDPWAQLGSTLVQIHNREQRAQQMQELRLELRQAVADGQMTRADAEEKWQEASQEAAQEQEGEDRMGQRAAQRQQTWQNQQQLAAQQRRELQQQQDQQWQQQVEQRQTQAYPQPQQQADPVQQFDQQRQHEQEQADRQIEQLHHARQNLFPHPVPVPRPTLPPPFCLNQPAGC